MPNPYISTQDWFYHAPSAKAQGSFVVPPIKSQIPGLSDLPEESVPDDNERQFRRKWIRDTDSKYVKLAKAGGRKDLLKFDNKSKPSSRPVLYPRVDWFDHDVHNDEVKPLENEQDITNNYAVLPDWYAHEQSLEVTNIKDKEVANTKQQRPMLGFDSMSVWQRNNLEQDSVEKSCSSKSTDRLPKMKKENVCGDLKYAKKLKLIKLPKIKSDIHSSEVSQDMKKLMSMDYQREWLLNKSQEDEKEMKAAQATRKEKRERDKHFAERQLQFSKQKKESASEKPRFKLSRFNKVKPCVDTRWAKLDSSNLNKSVKN